jgi:hypothetical protein
MKKATLLLLFTFVVVAMVYSQASFDDDVVDVAVPVDGGIVSVVGSAIVYGLYRNRKK